jgi:hypothetical protein
MKKVLVAIVLLISLRSPSAILAATSSDNGPCAPLPAVSSSGFEPFLEKFMNAFCYQKQNCQHDAEVRTTNGVHPYVKIWYSPSLWNWLTVDSRLGDVPDGAMLVKEQYVSLAAPLSEWTIMVKDQMGSWDAGTGRIYWRRPNLRSRPPHVASRRFHLWGSDCIA